VNPFMSTHGYEPFNVFTDCDMATAWRGLQLGGGAHIKQFMCHCCSIRSKELGVPNKEYCRTFCTELHSRSIESGDWDCYHREIEDVGKKTTFQQQEQEIRQKMKQDVDYISENSKFTAENSISCHNNPKSVYYTPTTLEQILEYDGRVTDELILREVNFTACTSWTDRCDLLREQLELEEHLQLLLKQIDRLENHEVLAVFAILRVIPCILHGENRVGLKLFTQLLRQGLSNAKDGKTFPNETSITRRVNLFLDSLQLTVNTQMLGRVLEPTEWKIPLSEDNKEIGTLTMSNGRMRSIIDKFELLLPICLVEADQIASWNKCIHHYRIGMQLLRQKEDFEDEEIPKVQYELDLFFREYVRMFGGKGVTNYIHLLGSGHMVEHLRAVKNLYRHSQQGWEHLNHLIKTFFFRRTSRGGAMGNTPDAKKSRLIPIGRWLQRRLIFLCGYTDEQICAAVTNRGELEEEEVEEDDLLTELFEWI
jgi:hypothetical protein